MPEETTTSPALQNQSTQSQKPLIDLSGIRPGAVAEGFHKYTGNPIGGAAAIGIGTGLATYALSPYAMEASFNMMSQNMTPQQRAKAYQDMIQNKQKNRMRLSMMAGGLAGGASLYNSYDPAKPMSSLTRWNYADQGQPAKPQGGV